MRKGYLINIGETSLCVNVKSSEILDKNVEDAQRKDNKDVSGVVERLALGGRMGAKSAFVDLKAEVESVHM